MKHKEHGLRFWARKQNVFMPGWGKWSTMREFFRAGFHMLAGIIAWFLVQVCAVGKWHITTAFIIVATIVLFYEQMRRIMEKQLRTGKHLPIGLAHLHQIIQRLFYREVELANEVKGSDSAFWAVLGFGILILWWLVFDLVWIGVACSLMFSFIDPWSKLIGMRWPIYRIKSGLAKGKSIGGMIGGSVFGFSVAALLTIIPHLYLRPFYPKTLSLTYILVIIGCGAVAGALAELFSGKRDNMYICIGSSLVMVLAYIPSTV